MSARDIKIEALRAGGFDEIVDVRSPSEFADDHIPGAVNCPVLDDVQRAEIGTIYKQVSPFEARRKGAALISRNIAHHIETVFSSKGKGWKPLVYCWRGGQRSAAMQTVLREIGWRAARLDGGYKAYRTHVLKQLETLPGLFDYVVINGPTGSGKTKILQALETLDAQVLDLEAMANHKGSVLGRNPGQPRQSSKAFDTALAAKLSAFDPARPVFVEAEGRRIGIVHLPVALFEKMGGGRTVHVRPSLAARIDYLIGDYGWLTQEPEKLRQYLTALRPLRGGEAVDRWQDFIKAADWRALVGDLLKIHYDPLYEKSSQRDYARADNDNSLAPEALDSGTFQTLAEKIMARFEAA